MTIISQPVTDIAGADDDTRFVFYRDEPLTLSTSGHTILTWTDVPVVPSNGVLTTPALEPGPARVKWNGHTYDIVIPDSAEPVELWPLIRDYQPQPAPVVSEVAELVREALRHRDESEAAAGRAETAAQNADQSADAAAADRAAAQAAAQNADQSADAAAADRAAAQAAAQTAGDDAAGRVEAQLVQATQEHRAAAETAASNAHGSAQAASGSASSADAHRDAARGFAESAGASADAAHASQLAAQEAAENAQQGAPAGGWPRDQLAQDIQNDLQLGRTALQEVPEATADDQGAIKLRGHLSGTASEPQIASGVIEGDHFAPETLSAFFFAALLRGASYNEAGEFIGLPTSLLNAELQGWISHGASAYQKPVGGIPFVDLDETLADTIRRGDKVPPFSQSRAAGYGSSTLERLGPLLATRLSGYGIDFHWQTGSVGAGRISAQVLAAGSLDPGIAAVTIPASGPVAVRPQAMTEDNAPPALSIPGRLGTVDGVLATAAGSTGWTFTRTTAGQPVALPEGAPFVPARAVEYGGGIQILNLGKNTLTADLSDWDVMRVVELTKRTAERFGAAGRRVLVVGHFHNTNTPASSVWRDRVDAVNSALFYAFGNRFFDLGGYLTGEAAREDTLYAVTAADTAQRNLKNKPPSLSSDDLHMNALAEAAVVARLEALMVEFGWLTVPSTITDDFERPNGPLVPGGLPWRTTHGLPLPVISSGALRRPVGATTEAYAVTRRPGGISSDYEVEYEYGTMGATPATKLAQLRVRWRSGENNVMISPRRDGSNEGYSIWKVVNGTLTKMGETPAGAVVAKGGDIVRVRCQGSTYTVWVNNVQRLQVTDASNPVGDIALRFDGADDSITRFTAHSL